MLVRARCCAFVIGNPSKLTAFANVLHGTARIGALDLYPPKDVWFARKKQKTVLNVATNAKT
jgi:hypothetical protein